MKPEVWEKLPANPRHGERLIVSRPCIVRSESDALILLRLAEDNELHEVLIAETGKGESVSFEWNMHLALWLSWPTVR